MLTVVILMRHLALEKQQNINFTLAFPETMRPLWEAKVEPVKGALWLQIEAEMNFLQGKLSPV